MTDELSLLYNIFDMSIKKGSFLSVNDLSDEDIQTILHRTRELKKLGVENKSLLKAFSVNHEEDLNAFLVFVEPSTRTRISFQVACNNLGISPVVLSDVKASSIAKGESVEETLRTLKCLNPSVIILRYNGSSFDFDLSVPIINAGFGSYEHPTQALTDAFTIRETKGKIEGERVLILGDVLHSRVSNSNLKLLGRLGAEVGFLLANKFISKRGFLERCEMLSEY